MSAEKAAHTAIGGQNGWLDIAEALPSFLGVPKIRFQGLVASLDPDIAQLAEPPGIFVLRVCPQFQVNGFCNSSAFGRIAFVFIQHKRVARRGHR